MERAISVYSKGLFPHYVIAWGGKLIQIAAEETRASHAGIDRKEYRAYRDGTWVNMVSKTSLDRWRARWREYNNPLELFPGRSPNSAYIGVELIPLLQTDSNNGSWFTQDQYQMLGYLCDDLTVRYGINLEGSRLVGHEDVEPLARWNRAGGWDPGAMRAKPRFLWSELRRWRTV